MTICEECKAQNEPGATHCVRCGRLLVPSRRGAAPDTSRSDSAETLLGLDGPPQLAPRQPMSAIALPASGGDPLAGDLQLPSSPAAPRAPTKVPWPPRGTSQVQIPGVDRPSAAPEATPRPAPSLSWQAPTGLRPASTPGMLLPPSRLPPTGSTPPESASAFAAPSADEPPDTSPTDRPDLRAANAPTDRPDLRAANAPTDRPSKAQQAAHAPPAVHAAPTVRPGAAPDWAQRRASSVPQAAQQTQLSLGQPPSSLSADLSLPIGAEPDPAITAALGHNPAATAPTALREELRAALPGPGDSQTLNDQLFGASAPAPRAQTVSATPLQPQAFEEDPTAPQMEDAPTELHAPDEGLREELSTYQHPEAAEATEPEARASLRLAGTGRRLLASLIDLALILAVLIGLGQLGLYPGVEKFSLDPDTLGPLLWSGRLTGVILGGLLLYLLGSLFFHGYLGATPGKLLTGIRLVRMADGERPGWGRATLRAFFGLGGLLFGLASYAWLILDRRGRCLQDLLCRTVAVRR